MKYLIKYQRDVTWGSKRTPNDIEKAGDALKSLLEDPDKVIVVSVKNTKPSGIKGIGRTPREALGYRTAFYIAQTQCGVFPRKGMIETIYSPKDKALLVRLSAEGKKYVTGDGRRKPGRLKGEKDE